jgi:hypothetical protein
VKRRIAQLTDQDGAVVCPAQPSGWRHATGVLGPHVSFWSAPKRSEVGDTEWGFSARAQEDVRWDAQLLPVDGPSGLSPRARTGLLWPTPSRRGTRLDSAGSLKAYRRGEVPLQLVRPGPGWYVTVVRLAAAMNPERRTLFVSAPFRMP